MNTKIFIWIAVVIVAGLLVIGGLYYFLGSATSPSPAPGGGTPEFPIGGAAEPGEEPGASANVVVVVLYDDTAIYTEDFIKNGETVADIENPGLYVLAGSVGYCLANGTCPRGAPIDDFNVSYNENTHFFNVTLLKEPLGPTRQAAEQFLRGELGITNEQMCALRYFVGTPYWVNNFYDNKNLGFSFCPGATALPN